MWGSWNGIVLRNKLAFFLYVIIFRCASPLSSSKCLVYHLRKKAIPEVGHCELTRQTPYQFVMCIYLSHLMRVMFLNCRMPRRKRELEDDSLNKLFLYSVDLSMKTSSRYPMYMVCQRTYQYIHLCIVV